MIKKEIEDKKELQCRCPACYYLVEKDVLFGIGCPICGWMSPVVRQSQVNVMQNGPQTDVFEDGDILRVTTELPAADEKNLILDVNGNKLLISSGGFNTVIQLSCAVEEIIDKTFINGVLDVQLKKAGR